MGKENDFSFLPLPGRDPKPRDKGITEIRGPYYEVIGTHYLEDVMECCSPFIDSVKFAGGAFILLPTDVLHKFVKTCHKYDVMVSTGGFIEHVLSKGSHLIDSYITACKNAGFDIIELSAGFIIISESHWLELIQKVQKAGLKAKPEIGIQPGAGGNTPAEELIKEEQKDFGYAVKLAEKFIDAGAFMIMIESEGITENIQEWQTHVPAAFINELGIDKLMFEAADPAVFNWYIKHYGPDVNLFVDHSQVLQLEATRRGL